MGQALWCHSEAKRFEIIILFSFVQKNMIIITINCVEGTRYYRNKQKEDPIQSWAKKILPEGSDIQTYTKTSKKYCGKRVEGPWGTK